MTVISEKTKKIKKSLVDLFILAESVGRSCNPAIQDLIILDRLSLTNYLGMHIKIQAHQLLH